MSENTPIRCAVIGCGHIGRRHAVIIDGHPDCELVAVADIRPREALNLPMGEEVRYFSDIADLLSAGLPLDVVHICTPNGLHAEQALAVLDAAYHVVIEKPMALNRADCERVIHRALNVGKQVFCVMQNRYSPAAVWLKEIIEQDALGDIYLVQLNCLWNRDERYYTKDGQAHPWHGVPELDGGVLFTQFAHFVDILYWLFGDIANIQTRLTNFRGLVPFPDSGLVSFDLLRGGMGNLLFSTATWDRNFESSITITGSKGSLQVAGQYMNELRYCHIEGIRPPTLEETPPPNDYGGYQGSAANHHYVIQNVVDVLRNRQEVKTNALEGMKVVDMIERILESGS